jgi:glycosyltransferase involved in cell wall biosynthesis
VKNHSFLVEILSEVAKRIPEAQLLLVGDGPLRPQIEQQAIGLGLADQVVFAGSRSDVARLMLGAMDLFLFPSHYEGLGLVLVEAQAAGLPCLCSDVIPPEADAVRALVRRLSLSQPASVWAEHVLAARESPLPVGRREALAMVEQSPFSIRRSVQELEAVYGA